MPTKTCLHTCVERRTRFLVARLVHDKGVAATSRAELDSYSALPARAHISHTWDYVGEASDHHIVEQALGMACYFVDSYSSWYRGSNENRNGQIRCYFPTGTDLTQVSQDDVDQAIAEINNRYMLLLDGLTPARAFTNVLQQLQPGQKTNVLRL